jgi:long-chain-fatty-acid--CoA ligase ACSBG
VQTNFREYYNAVIRAAKSLIKLGVEPGHGVCILGFNAPEWHISNLAGIVSGAMACGIYATNNADACYHVMNDCKAQAIFCENKAQIKKILEIRDRLPNLKAIIQYLPEPLDPEQKDAGVLSYSDFLDIGQDVPDYEVQWRIEKQKPGSCCSLIYTSGTTGPPKGVMLSHDNITWTAKVCASLYNLTEDEHMISYLPLSHVAAAMLDIYMPLQMGVTIWFAQPDALKGSLLQTMKHVRPTAFMGVPRVWEKVRDALQRQFQTMTGFKGKIVSGARSIGRRRSIQRMEGNTDKPWGYWLADKFCFQKVREGAGLDRCRIQIVGAAPIARDVLEFFLDLDIPIYEIYGMSESSGPQTVSFDGCHRAGTSGRLMAGAEMKIDKPDEFGEGEICFRGRHVFMGYLNNAEKSKEAIDEDGWLHSGDLGSLDKDGYLKITGRLKELIITKGGENVAPLLIEQSMKKEMPLLSQVVVIGDNQKYLTMLVSLKCELDDSNAPTDKLDQTALSVLAELGCEATTVSVAKSDPKVHEYIKRGMQQANEAALSRAQKVQKYTILPEDLSPAYNTLTPTLKMKRKIISQKYAGLIDRMYEEQPEASRL